MPHLLYNTRFKKDEFPLNIHDFINYFIERGEPNRPVIIVPTGRYGRLLKKRFIRNYFKIHNKPVENPNIFTLSTFSNYCYGKYFPFAGGRFISEAYRMNLIEEAFSKVQLKFYAASKNGRTGKPSPAIIEKMGTIIKGLKEDGITPAQIIKELELYSAGNAEKREEITHFNKLSDIYEVFNAYQELLGAQFVDQEQKLINLTNAVKSEIGTGNEFYDELFPASKVHKNFALDNYFGSNAIFYFYGFSEFKRPEIEFLSLFAGSALPTAINLDYTEKNGPLFGNLKESVLSLTSVGFNDSTVLENTNDFNTPEEYIDGPRSVYLRRWLFNSEKEVRNPKFESMIKLIATESRFDEVKSIAKLIKWLHTEKKTALKDICVCMRNPEIYSNSFRETFRLNEIPLNLSDRYPLEASPLITAIFAALDLGARQWRRDDIMKVTSAAYFETKIKNELKIDSANFYSCALNMKIESGFKRGGAKFWKNAFERSIASTNKRIEYLKADENQDENDLDASNKKLANLEKAAADFDKLAELFNWEEGSYTYSEFNTMIKEKIIVVLGIRSRLLEHFDNAMANIENLHRAESVKLIEEAEKDVRAFEKFIQVLDELTSIAYERYPDAKINAADFSAKLKTAVRAEKYQTREKPDYGVTVTAVEQVRQLPFKVFILCGAADGEFPMAYRTDTFLGKELPETESRFYCAEKTLFYQFLASNHEGLDSGENSYYIFFPKKDGNQEITSSPFINALSKITTINLSEEAAKNIPGYKSRYYDLELLREARINPSKFSESTINSISDIPWLDVIAEKGEYLKLYSEYVYKRFKNSGLSVNDSANLEKIEKIIHNKSIIDDCKYINEYVASGDKPNFSGLLSKTSDENSKLLSEDASSKLDKVLSKEISISALENYAKCPYKYFVERMLKISAPEKDNLTISPLETGSALHYVLYKFYMELKKEQGLSEIQGVELDSGQRDKYLEMIKEIAKIEKDNIEKYGATSKIEAELLFGSEETVGLIEKWLDNELKKISEKWGFKPALFETSFGYDYSKKSYTDAITFSNGLKLRGRIDRLEINESNKTFLIADYKTSFASVGSDKDISNFKKFQIPLYLKAAQMVLKNKYKVDFQPAGGVYYALKKAKVKEKFYKFSLPGSSFFEIAKNTLSDSEIEFTVDKSIEAAGHIVDNISAGKFVATPDTKVCQYCDFSSICGKTYGN